MDQSAADHLSAFLKDFDASIDDSEGQGHAEPSTSDSGQTILEQDYEEEEHENCVIAAPEARSSGLIEMQPVQSAPDSSLPDEPAADPQMICSSQGEIHEPPANNEQNMASAEQFFLPVESLDNVTGVTTTVLLPVMPVQLADGKIVMQLQMPPNTNSAAVAQIDAQQAALHIQQTYEQQHLMPIAPTTSQNRTEREKPSEHQSKKARGPLAEDLKLDPALEAAISKNEVFDEQSGKMSVSWHCTLCDYYGLKRYVIVRHMRTHSEARPFVCSVADCARAFKTGSALKNHVDTHALVKKYACKDCPMRFGTSGELNRHVRYKHTLERPHCCPYCDFKCVELTSLKRHLRSHTGEKPYKCAHCRYEAIDQARLRRHERVHTGEKPYECEQCKARFTQANSLTQHMATHVPWDDRPLHPCPICPKKLTRATDLKNHIKRMHESDKAITCALCLQKFADKWSLIVHKQAHKRGDRWMKCSLCEYKTSAHRFLAQHMMTHSEDKPFVCKIDGCNRCFRQLPQLKRHQLLHNPDYSKQCKQKVLVCDVCGQSFSHKANLHKHIQAHQMGHIDDQGLPLESTQVHDGRSARRLMHRKGLRVRAARALCAAIKYANTHAPRPRPNRSQSRAKRSKSGNKRPVSPLLYNLPHRRSTRLQSPQPSYRVTDPSLDQEEEYTSEACHAGANPTDLSEVDALLDLPQTSAAYDKSRDRTNKSVNRTLHTPKRKRNVKNSLVFAVPGQDHPLQQL